MRTRPWLGSTGPRSAEGKNRSKINALKHGGRSAAAVQNRKAVNEALRLLRELMRLDAQSFEGC